MNLSQKLSGFAKTFWSALLTRWRGVCDSVWVESKFPFHSRIVSLLHLMIWCLGLTCLKLVQMLLAQGWHVWLKVISFLLYCLQQWNLKQMHKQKNINHQTKVSCEMSWWRFLLSSELFPARKTQTERAKRKKLKISNKQGVFLWNWLAISTSKMNKQRVRPIQGGMSDLEGYLVPSQLSSTWKSQQTSSLYLGQQLEQTGRENRQVPSAIVSFLQLF